MIIFILEATIILLEYISHWSAQVLLCYIRGLIKKMIKLNLSSETANREAPATKPNQTRQGS